MSVLPRVSVITPSFQQARYLEQTMLSVLEQGYPNLEYLVVDGGSTDGSVDIIQQHAGRLAWWVSEPDRGQAEAINKGFARASGEIIAWLNSDDLYLPGAIAAAVQALQQDPSLALVFADVRSIDADGVHFNTMRFANWALDDLLCFNIISQPGVFMRRSALEQAGYLDAGYHLLLDHHLWLRVAQHGGMRYIPQQLAAARFHAQAKNVAKAAEFGEEAYRIARWIAAEPALAERYARLEKQVWAGAHRINARYLLDAALYRQSLSAYLKSLRAAPAVALPESHRMLYALLGMLGMGRLGTLYYRLRARFRKPAVK